MSACCPCPCPNQPPNKKAGGSKRPAQRRWRAVLLLACRPACKMAVCGEVRKARAAGSRQWVWGGGVKCGGGVRGRAAGGVLCVATPERSQSRFTMLLPDRCPSPRLVPRVCSRARYVTEL